VTSATFPSGAPSIAAARHFVATALPGLGPGVLADVTLMVSELATNVVHHAGTTFRVSVERTPSRVRVAVSDSGAGRPARRDPGPHDTTGRGLLIVDQLAEAWGVEPDPPGKSVWFSVRVPEEAADAGAAR